MAVFTSNFSLIEAAATQPSTKVFYDLEHGLKPASIICSTNCVHLLAQAGFGASRPVIGFIIFCSWQGRGKQAGHKKQNKTNKHKKTPRQAS